MKLNNVGCVNPKGEKEYSQAEVDDFIYKTYYKKGKTNAI